MSRRPGRPARGAAVVTPEAMLDAALALLDAGGSEALTMRALAAALGINPMTIHHHFGGREGLVCALADRVYADVEPPECSSARERLEELLRAYRARVRRHPALTLEIFRNRTAFPAQARRISDSLVELLGELGLPPPRALSWRDLLVDYLHGAALAEALREPDAPFAEGAEPSAGCFDPLTELLELLSSNEAARRARG